MYGLETLSQLISFDFDSQSYVVRAAPWHVVDAPRFQHRVRGPPTLCADALPARCPHPVCMRTDSTGNLCQQWRLTAGDHTDHAHLLQEVEEEVGLMGGTNDPALKSG